MIAQEVQQAYPQLVSADTSGTLSVNYNGLVAPLIEAVKELHADVKELHAQNDPLQAELASDHAVLKKLRHHVALTPAEIDSTTKAMWH